MRLNKPTPKAARRAINAVRRFIQCLLPFILDSDFASALSVF